MHLFFFLFFWHAKSILAGGSEAEDEGSGETDAGRKARTLPDTREKLAGHEGWICHVAPYRKNQTNQTAARKLTSTDMGKSLVCM
jgi:hypothetical protein